MRDIVQSESSAKVWFAYVVWLLTLWVAFVVGCLRCGLPTLLVVYVVGCHVVGCLRSGESLLKSVKHYTYETRAYLK